MIMNNMNRNMNNNLSCNKNIFVTKASMILKYMLQLFMKKGNSPKVAQCNFFITIREAPIKKICFFVARPLRP